MIDELIEIHGTIVWQSEGRFEFRLGSKLFRLSYDDVVGMVRTSTQDTLRMWRRVAFAKGMIDELQAG